ncbi:unnamed protein product [Closterium sp. NIES-53]
MRIVQNVRFNLLTAAQIMDCGVGLSTDPETRDILLHYTAPTKAHKQIGRAHSENGVYILGFDIPDCSGDLQELIDLVPLRFQHIHRLDGKHPDGRPWVPHHPHPRELALHDPDPDGICKDCHMPTASTSAIASRGLATIAEDERLEPTRGPPLSAARRYPTWTPPRNFRYKQESASLHEGAVLEDLPPLCHNNERE